MIVWNVIGCILVLVLSRLIYRAWIAEKRIEALGGHAHVIPAMFPFGFDLIYRDVRAAITHKSMELWQTLFYESKGSHTAEATVMGQRIVFTDDPKNIKAILSAQFQDFGKGKPFYDDWYDFLGASIFTTDHEAWHASRNLLRPLFTKTKAFDLQIFEKHVLNLFDQFPDKGTTFDFNALFLRYTMDVSTEFLLGQSTNSLQDSSSTFAKAFAEVQRMQNIFVRAGPAKAIIPRYSFKKNLALIDDFIYPYIHTAIDFSNKVEAESGSRSSPSFLQDMQASTTDPKVLRDQLVAMLLASRDTTASTLSWLFYELSRNPSMYQKAREEVLRTVGADTMPTTTDLRRMEYVQNAITETLRMYPSVPFNVRMALHDTTLPTGGGTYPFTSPVGILKDTAIAYSTLTLHRRDEFFSFSHQSTGHATPSPASTFDPDRWLASWRPEDNYTYIPFNAGPRVCIGQEFALLETKYTAVRVLQKIAGLQTRMKESEQWLNTAVVMQPGGGVKVAIVETEVS